MIKRLFHHGISNFILAKFLTQLSGHLILDDAHLTLALELGDGKQCFHNAITTAECLCLFKDGRGHDE